MTSASKHQGRAVLAFPDVCKTPSPGGPVPIPYPNIGTASSRRIAKTGLATKPPTALKGSGLSQQHRGRLIALHGQLIALNGSDPNRWHALLDEYVQTAAELYKSVAS